MVVKIVVEEREREKERGRERDAYYKKMKTIERRKKLIRFVCLSVCLCLFVEIQKTWIISPSMLTQKNQKI